ncbi:cache domain-containing protein [Arcobacter sp. F155]|uniref:cache domain-containing protein n=1 Tax=Arcobacter sp. F155 TaxID=2044512 RepID=UPI0013E93B07|nr:cache domain-containing protein [Arcobacter sp. F155]
MKLKEKNKTKEKVLKLILQLELYQNFLLKDKKNNEEVNRVLLKFIKTLSFNVNDYIFVFDSNGKQLIHFEDRYEGVNRINLQDSNGTFIIRDLIKIGKSLDGGFLEYTASTGDKDLSKDKISYVNYFAANDWIIGSGVYLDYLTQSVQIEQNKLKKELNNQLFIYMKYSILFILFFLIIGYYLYKHIEGLLDYYKEVIESKNQKLRDLNKLIKTKVIEVKEDNKKKDQLLFQREKLAFMGELLNNIAHQWRQPLNEIISYASISNFSLKNKKISKQELHKNLDGIVSTTTYLSQTIEDFRSFFSNSSNKEFKSTEKIIEQALNLFQPISKKENIKVLIENKIKDKFILNSFLQVLLNLLNNSKDAFTANHIKNRLVKIKLNFVDNKILISYMDNAGGIPEKLHDRIFEPYFTTKGDSQGIGLHMTYQILTLHMKATIEISNKRIEVDGMQQVGACFDIKVKEYYE